MILCSGKVYYDLLNYQTEQKLSDAVVIRLEQLYPLCEEKLRAIVGRFAPEAKLVWCQEESQNMGAWSFIEPRLRGLFGRAYWFGVLPFHSLVFPGMLRGIVHDAETLADDEPLPTAA